MTDEQLADELRALGRSSAVPPVADGLAAAVLERIGDQPVRRSLAGRLRNRWRALVAGLLVLLGGLALAPPVRATVANWLGLDGVVVRQVPSGPTTAPQPPAASSAGLSLAEAAARVGFTPVVPAELGPPKGIEVSPDRRILVMSWQTADGTVRLEQFAGRVSPTYVKQVYDQVEVVPLRETVAYWFKSPHELVLVDLHGVERTQKARTAGPTLVWERDETVTLRLEGIAQRNRAQAVAESVR